MTDRVDTIVIGAGPAGLAAAVCLQRAGVPYRVVERGDAALTSLRRVRPELTLTSPTRVSRLPDMREADGAPTYLRFDELAALLEQYRARHDIAVDTGVDVTRVDRDGAGFVLHGPDGRIAACQSVINATGIIRYPRIPKQFERERCAIPAMHSVDVRAEHLADRQAPLIVGGGMSAAETAEIWLQQRAGGRAYLSLRSRLRAIPRAILGLDVHYLSWLPERLPARTPGLRRLFRRDPVSGFVLGRAIRRGLVERVPEIAAYHEAEVELSDGRRLTPDVIVFATGFSYAAPHLGDLVERDDDGILQLRGCESTRCPGLYVLGARFGRTLASPYLRGIARDAAYVARHIARRGDR